MTPTIRIERTIAAPRHRVYRAWLDTELVTQWMAPGMPVTRVEIDERVGGHYRVWQGDSGSGFDGEILELVPDERIVFRWGFAGPEREKGPVFDSQLTITLRDAPRGGTVLTLVHERLDALAKAMPDVADKVEPGWEMVLTQLATAIEGEQHA
jgi:uncharacterized protein YndB with AHSA1/START domain